MENILSTRSMKCPYRHYQRQDSLERLTTSMVCVIGHDFRACAADVLFRSQSLHWINPSGAPRRQPGSGNGHANDGRDGDGDGNRIERAEVVEQALEDVCGTERKGNDNGDSRQHQKNALGDGRAGAGEDLLAVRAGSIAHDEVAEEAELPANAPRLRLSASHPVR